MKKGKKLTASIKSAGILAASACVIAITAMTMQNLSASESASACVCSNSTASYNPSLPASHPNNRCARQTEDLSWTNWFAGKSRSNQLHFVDLLELLYGHSEIPLDEVTPANSQQNGF
ncbi:hypothetical protein FM038_023320 [Shewanella eurypsychrophilus]|uniref:Uncharacterized protein n=1 Tax=Shewanella eurypsychrophilus TaxID=2593656 RepID=A0ABX6VBZ9_9GAMM|nr:MULTISPECIES: hypothetical protein [Shewanella]QFU24772.1 hypothetical protein FS418_24980 [Shewanella sp. YLB-09]QPG59962.1 hypothetical protein FM038_023320 [Shewanella eurypsychrophilus]